MLYIDERGQKYPDLKSLRKNVRDRHELTIEQYCRKFFARKDLHSGEAIPFKTYEQYFASLFVSRENLVKYFLANPKDYETLKLSLSLRKEHKGLLFAPATFEARTTILPTPMLVKKIGHDYATLVENVGLENRFDYHQNLQYEAGILSVLVDTREQTPLKLTCEQRTSKLDFGDYCCRSHYKSVYAERKSLGDFVGTMSKGYERFEREIERAAAAECYIVVLVESSLKSLLLLDKSSVGKFSACTPEFICSRARDLAQKHSNLQFAFVDGRLAAAQTLEKIFRLKNDVRKTDLQYFVDSGEL
jgi:hypothetical protein